MDLKGSKAASHSPGSKSNSPDVAGQFSKAIAEGKSMFNPAESFSYKQLQNPVQNQS